MWKRITCLALSMLLLLGILVQQVVASDDIGTQQEAVLESAGEAEQQDSAPENTDETEQRDAAPENTGETEQRDAAPEDAGETEQRDAAPEDTGEAEQQDVVSQGPSILVDGVVVEDAAPTLYEQTTYISLRHVALALRPDATVTWVGDHAAVTAEGLTIKVYPDLCYMEANGRYLYLPHGVRLMNGTTMVPVRALAQALGAQVWWDAEKGNTHITSGTGAIVSGEEFYNADALYWLSQIIYAESGNQPLKGKIGVGNVILNRVKHPSFPNTIYDVVFQKNQFTPARTGSIYADPNPESVIAAKLCLDGAVVLPNALWFNAAGVSCWASRNKTCIATIGNHAFYA